MGVSMINLLIVLGVAFLHGPISWSASHGRVVEASCLPIPDDMLLCQGLPYSQMSVPNLVGQDSVAEIQRQASAWEGLLGIHCHKHIKEFLCSMFAPVCTASIQKPVYPCRHLCESFKNDCEADMKLFSFPWPYFLNCSTLPSPPNLCIDFDMKNQLSTAAPEGPEECAACALPDTQAGIAKNYCLSDYMVRMKVRKLKEKNGRRFYTTKRSSTKKKTKVRLIGNSRDSNLEKKIGNGPLYLPDSTCTCSPNRFSPGENHLIGLKRNAHDELEVAFITNWKETEGSRKRTKMAIKKFIKMLKKGKEADIDICKGGYDVLRLQKSADQEVQRQEEKRRKKKLRSKKNFF